MSDERTVFLAMAKTITNAEFDAYFTERCHRMREFGDVRERLGRILINLAELEKLPYLTMVAVEMEAQLFAMWDDFDEEVDAFEKRMGEVERCIVKD